MSPPTDAAKGLVLVSLVPEPSPQGPVLVAIDDWKGASKLDPPLCYGARVVFADDATEFLARLTRAGAASWHASGRRGDFGFLFTSERFDDILDYLDVGPTCFYGMLQRPEHFETPRFQRQVDELLKEHPQLGPLLPENPYARGLFWFLDRLLHKLVEDHGSRPIQVFIDALDWDNKRRRAASTVGSLSYGASSTWNVTVSTVVDKTGASVAEAAALLGLVDSELWAFGRIQTLPLPDGSTLRQRLLNSEQSAAGSPLLSQDEFEYMLRPHRNHRQLQEYWSRRAQWMRHGRMKVLKENG